MSSMCTDSQFRMHRLMSVQNLSTAVSCRTMSRKSMCEKLPSAKLHPPTRRVACSQITHNSYNSYGSNRDSNTNLYGVHGNGSPYLVHGEGEDVFPHRGGHVDLVQD